MLLAIGHWLLALMTLVEARSVTLSSSGLVKMEERKRPASYENDDAAPPQKRQATANTNGAARVHQDADMPGKDELEVSLANIFSHPLSKIILASSMAQPWSKSMLTRSSRIQRFQKDAIWRQMQEYKREKTTLEARLSDITKRIAYHDDHLRLVDAWFNQVRQQLWTLTLLQLIS